MPSNQCKRMQTGSFKHILLPLLFWTLSASINANEQDELYADYHWRDDEVRNFMFRNLGPLIKEKYPKEPDFALRATLMSISIVDAIKDDELQALGYLFIGAQTPFKQHREPLLNQALESAMRMDNIHNKDWILEFVAAQQSVTNFEAALKTINKMTNEHVKPFGLIKIAKEQHKRELQFRALTLAVEIAKNFEPEFKIDAYLWIGAAFSNFEFNDEADILYEQMIKLEQTMVEKKERKRALDETNTNINPK